MQAKKQLLYPLAEEQFHGRTSSDKESVKAPFVYLLRMVWLGRADKMASEKFRVLSAVSDAVLSEIAGYQRPKPGLVILRGENHYLLADTVFDALWDAFIDGSLGVSSHCQPTEPESLIARIGRKLRSVTRPCASK